MDSSYKEYVSVDPDGEYRDDMADFQVVQEANSGMYKIEGWTKITGETNSSNYNYNYLQITQ